MNKLDSEYVKRAFDIEAQDIRNFSTCDECLSVSIDELTLRVASRFLAGKWGDVYQDDLKRAVIIAFNELGLQSEVDIAKRAVDYYWEQI